MIQNERQYRVSRRQAAHLRAVRAGYEAQPHDDPLAQAGLLASVTVLLERVEAELAEYEALAAGTVTTLTAHTLAALPEALIRGRIAAGLTQRELGARLGVSEKQVQRDEAGGYAQATFERLWKVADALGLEVEQTFYFHRTTGVA
jgi:DNA-binding XRE family transcriptional regulator